MIDKKSLFGYFMSPSTLALATLGMFEEGQTIILSGMSNASLGGRWPRWMDRCHVPERARFWIQTVCDHFDHKFGPRRYQIIGVPRGSSLTIASR